MFLSQLLRVPKFNLLSYTACYCQNALFGIVLYWCTSTPILHSCIHVKMVIIIYYTFNIKFVLCVVCSVYCVVCSAIHVVNLQPSFMVCFPISLKFWTLALHWPENPHDLVCVIALLSLHCLVHRSVLPRLQGRKRSNCDTKKRTTCILWWRCTWNALVRGLSLILVQREQITLSYSSEINPVSSKCFLCP